MTKESHSMDDRPKQKHIALYVPNLGGGGAERVMVMLANGFSAAGHKVDLVLAHATGPYLSEVVDAVEVVDLRCRRVLTSLLPLARYLRRARPDVLLSALNHSNIVAILARKLAGTSVRLMVSEHNSLTQGSTNKGLQAVMLTLIRRLYPAADGIICVSDGIREDMIRHLGFSADKVHCVYNPLDVDQIHTLKNAPVDHPWLTEHTHPVILAVGRLTEQKDYPTLLRAVAQLSKERAVRLIVLGQGEDEAMLKNLATELSIDDRVAFMGFQDNPFAWMNVCDLYVMCSRWEGLPGTLLEALACNMRIVSTDCRTGPDEILEGGRWGRLVPVSDPARLADAIETALNDPALPDGARRAEAFRPERATAEYSHLIGA